jgi:hypothetical protein
MAMLSKESTKLYSENLKCKVSLEDLATDGRKINEGVV